MAKKKQDDPKTPEDESLQDETPVEDLEKAARDAEAAAAAARAKAEEARQVHLAAAAKAEDDKLDPTKHILLDTGSGAFTPVEFPDGAELDKDGRCRSRALTLGGQNVEHVGDRTFHKSDGSVQTVWCYRRM